ncbi:MAG: FAD-binding oxidoreductase [Hyphomicrobiaceae bacterium]
MIPASTPRRPVPSEVVERLKAVAGAAGVLDDPADMAPYCTSWRGDYQGRVPLIVRPQTTAEVAAVVKICAETRTPIVPQGGNTGLTGAGQPGADGSEIILSTSRLKRVRAVDTANDTLALEAGVVLADAQRIAAEHNRLFPLSLGAEGSCHIGGNLSTNAGGTQVLRYGNMRSLVLGLEVVLPDGRIWDGLRSLRKDNTGYDLKHLFIGAEGTLGIITAAVLRLFPRPTAVETAWLGVSGPEAAVALLGHMRSRLGERISAFELMQRLIVDFLLAGVPGHTDPMTERYPWYVLAEVSGQGGPGTLAEPFAGALAEALDKGMILDAVVAQSTEQAKRFWKMREDFAEAQKTAGVGIKHDVAVPVSQVPTFIARCNAALEDAYPGIRNCAFGHVGDGNLHYNPMAPPNWEGRRFAAERERVNRIVHDLVASFGGSISAEHGIGRLRLEENERYKSPVELDLMRTVKRVLDPDNIMNPGKVVRVL